jgi:PadR family transcriptional regulator
LLNQTNRRTPRAPVRGTHMRKQMTGRTILAEFEELVLLAVLRLGTGAYGVPIGELLEQATGRSISIGALYATLDRLQRKGFVRSWFGEATPERGGRAKRFFEVEPAGKEALKQAEQARRNLVPKLKPVT